MQFLCHERELVDDCLNSLAEGHARSVAGAGFDADEDGVWAGWTGGGGGLEGGGVFEAVGGKDAVVVVGGGDEGGRVTGARPDVMEGGVPVDGGELFRVI